MASRRLIPRTIAEARRDFADTLNRVIFAGERVVLLRRGKPVAALVSLADLEALGVPVNATGRGGRRKDGRSP